MTTVFSNGKEDFIELDGSVIKEGNIFNSDPYMDNTTFAPTSGSPCINAGISKYERNGKKMIELDAKYISGPAPDIGAVEQTSR
ncbi:MAG TPA: hypothetical protein DDW27_01060 [Bacteroidales bacterium]|nr:hypothetical protein [Bacteroidales bacterium]